jgi:hypothetical protein
VRLHDSTRRWIPELLARQLIVAGVVLYGGYDYTAAEELVKRVEFSRPEIVAEYGFARRRRTAPRVGGSRDPTCGWPRLRNIAVKVATARDGAIKPNE